MNSQNLGLTVLLSYQIKCLSNTEVVMVRKFLDEMLKFSSLWPGKMRLLIEQDPKKTELLETVTIKISELPFKLIVVSFKDLSPAVLLEDTNIVYSAVSPKHNHISQYCKQGNVPCVYISECTLKARKQMKAFNIKNPIRLWRNYLWEDNQEKKHLLSIVLANGIQCNGTPTYEEYRQINSNALLYFDNRVNDDLLAKPEEIEERTQYLCENKQPIRLCFSGRLIKMKGADHLIDIAQHLKQLEVQFQMFICGDGDLKDKMQKRISASDLNNDVKMMGMLPFKKQLLPFLKKNVDVFVCCHIQSDPSCTYLETMSCGVPIIGYANEAFLGVVKYSQAGWLIDIDQPRLLANKLVELNKNRQAIKDMSFLALKFAQEHTFEKTYERRLKHIEQTYYQFKENVLSVV
ncbi:glycosyltransferase family 4 protein [Iningainema sp. BLCCT55]|uniref:Glycosyltransferase family 4 protein n=2 Tax=Iningainema TaxID=1932705 RepID=A0A8J7CBI0_9CYAN|nr:glycosyltransferase family 4 protein [Iningainema tapete BLCC-T55]